MHTKWDPTDVPPVRPDELAVPMQLLAESGRTPLLPQGISDEFMRELEHRLWQQLGPDTGRSVAVRFRSLVHVLATRRSHKLLKKHGQPLLSRAVETAAGMRLNANWGFSPTKFVVALDPGDRQAHAQPRKLAEAA